MFVEETYSSCEIFLAAAIMAKTVTFLVGNQKKNKNACMVKTALYKYRTVGHGIVLYTSVHRWNSELLQAWYSISFLSKYSTQQLILYEEYCTFQY